MVRRPASWIRPGMQSKTGYRCVCRERGESGEDDDSNPVVNAFDCWHRVIAHGWNSGDHHEAERNLREDEHEYQGSAHPDATFRPELRAKERRPKRGSGRCGRISDTIPLRMVM